MNTRRGKRYTQTEVDASIRGVLDEVRELRAENVSLKAQNAGLKAQLADADDVLMQFEGRLREVGRQDAMGAHPSLGGEPESAESFGLTGRRSTAASPPASGGTSEGAPPARLRLVSPVTSTEGKQT